MQDKKRASTDAALVPKPRKGLDWDDEDLTTRVFDRPAEEFPVAFEDSALLELDFDAEHTSRITHEELEALKAKIKADEEERSPDDLALSAAAPTSALPTIEVLDAAEQTALSPAHRVAREIVRRRRMLVVWLALTGVLVAMDHARIAVGPSPNSGLGIGKSRHGLRAAQAASEQHSVRRNAAESSADARRATAPQVVARAAPTRDAPTEHVATDSLVQAASVAEKRQDAPSPVTPRVGESGPTTAGVGE